MADGPRNILLVATEPLTGGLLAWLRDAHADAAVTMLKLTADRDAVDLPTEWRILRPTDLGSSEQLGKDILAFLTAVAETPLANGKTFDQQFRLAGDSSLWWVGPASYRHQDKAVYAALRAAWLTAKALDQANANEVLVLTARRNVAAMVASQCTDRSLPCMAVPGSATPARTAWTGRTTWLARTWMWLVTFPWLVLIRAIMARMLTRANRPSRAERDRPAAVMTGAFPRHVREDDSGLGVWYWQVCAHELARRDGHLRQQFLLHTVGAPSSAGQMRHGLYHTGWRTLRRLKGLLPIEHRHAPLLTYLGAAFRQLAAMGRLGRVERQDEFRQRLRFCGADVSVLYVPLIRQEVARMAAWAVNIAAIAKSLRAAGNVRLLIVNEEFYGWGMRDIAAARRLNIPTLGVEHGAIFPMHLIYTPPPAQIANTPIPDHFAVYGQFAKDVVSEIGAYPAERVTVTGGPRFDHLVNAPPDADAARQRLGFAAEKKLVLITTNFFRWFQDVARSVFTACKDRDDVVVCLKTHPNDFPLSVYETIARDCGAGNVHLFDDRFDDLLAACDVLVGGFSTTVIEAILLGRTTICVNFSDEEYRYPFVADGGSLPARTNEELTRSLATALSGEADGDLAAGRDRFLARHMGPSASGHAAAALAELIGTLTDAKES